MPGMDVGRALEPAFKHMAAMLFRPFMLRMWLALGLIYWFAYGGSGGFNGSGPGGGGGGDEELRELLDLLVKYWWVVALVVFVGMVISLFFTWLSSVLQFVYVDDITRKSGAIWEPFGRLMGLGTSYFLWRVIFGIVVTLAMALLIVLPLVWAFVPSFHAGTGAKIAAVAWAVAAFMGMLFLAIIIDVFARDFVVAAMYARGVRVIEGWRTVLPILRANAGQVVLYLLLLIGLAIGMGIVGFIVMLLLGLVFAILLAIPVLVLVGLGILLWESVGEAGVVSVVILGAAVAVPALLALMYAYICAMQPALVFRRAFSLVVLGQADPSLVTVPIGTPPPERAAPQT